MDFLMNDDEEPVVLHRPTPLVTLCPYGLTAYVRLLNQTKGFCGSYDPDYGHRCKDNTCVGYVEDEPEPSEFYTGSLGDAVYASRKGYAPVYEPKVEEPDEEEPDEEVVEALVVKVSWPTMSDAEVRKAERKRVNRR